MQWIILKKNKWKRSYQSRKTIYFFISNEDMNDIIKIIKSLKDSNLLIYGITQTVKNEIKNKKVDFFSSKRYKSKNR